MQLKKKKYINRYVNCRNLKNQNKIKCKWYYSFSDLLILIITVNPYLYQTQLKWD